MAVTAISGEDVQVHIDSTTSNFFDSSSQLEGISSVEISGGEKDLELIHAFSSTAANRFFTIDKPATIVTVELEGAVFDGTIFDGYFSGSNLATPTTRSFALGIKMSSYEVKIGNCVAVARNVSANIDGTVTADITVKASPADVTD